MFDREIGDSWDFNNWTSRLRRDAHFPPFTGRKEKDFADFTYQDNYGLMRGALRVAGVPLRPEWSNNTTYHLEVKTTQEDCAEPFFISQNQVDLVSLKR
jgi:hypothetical protein